MKRREKKSSDNTIYGINPVLEALESGKRKIHRLLVVKNRGNRRIDGIVDLARKRGIEVRMTDGREMSLRFPERQDQGVAAETSPFAYSSLEDVLSERRRPCLLAALDEIQDTRNLGAIVRSAAAFGADGVIIHADRCAGVTPVTVKASAGMTERVSIARVVNLAAAIRRARDEGIWVLGLDAGSPDNVYNEDLTADVMFVLGSEGKGLRKLTASLCDGLVSIPVSSKCESLNVSTAAAVVLAEAARQRTVAAERQ
ncbi:MAG: 23S rRNA (guanosine(2251)-2'-O)-methyltransferase RlmB [Pseudomonadota bacterium]